MLFRQLFDRESSTYTYLIAGENATECVIIDPVREQLERDLRLIRELELQLVLAVDTHVHADHVTALGPLQDATGCATAMGEQSAAENLTWRFHDGQVLELAGLRLTVMHTPGHTDCSCSLYLPDRVFTGDTLLIRGSGRTDFQNGDAGEAYDSLFRKLLTLPDGTRVYPAHDYNGMTVSTIGEERRWNPRLQVRSRDEYVALMNGLDLDPPRRIDEAVPANRRLGRAA
jgi:glyoxylase-like metal-dependent hydrolase (beta-lactamase superfamily II)